MESNKVIQQAINDLKDMNNRARAELFTIKSHNAAEIAAMQAIVMTAVNTVARAKKEGTADEDFCIQMEQTAMAVCSI